MPQAAAIAPIVGGVGSLVGGAKGSKAQQQQSGAAGQAYGAESGLINNIVAPYLSSMLPTSNTLGQYLAQNVPGAQGNANAVASGLSGFNPYQQGQIYLPMLNNYGRGSGYGQDQLAGFGQSPLASSLAGFGQSPFASSLASFSSPFQTQAGSTVGALQSFNGLSPAQMAALTSTLGQSGLSTINSIRGNLGGAANPAALIQSLFNQNQATSENAALQLGAQGASQQLGALQSAGQIASGLSGQQLSGLQSAGQLGLGGLQDAGQLGLQGLQSAGQLGLQGAQAGTQAGINISGQELQGLESAGGLYSGQAGQSIGGFGSLLNPAGSLTSSGLSGLQGIGDTYNRAAQAQGNPWGNALGGIAGAISGIGSLSGYGGGGSGYQSGGAGTGSPWASNQRLAA